MRSILKKMLRKVEGTPCHHVFLVKRFANRQSVYRMPHYHIVQWLSVYWSSTRTHVYLVAPNRQNEKDRERERQRVRICERAYTELLECVANARENLGRNGPQ